MSTKHKLVPMAGVNTTVINIICNILGGALLVLPTAFMNMSVIPGIIFTILMGLFSVSSIVMMIIPAAKYNKFTYKDLLTCAFSDRVGRTFDVVLLFYTYGLLIEFAKIVAQAVPPAAEDIAGVKNGDGGQLYTQQWFWLVLAFPLFWAFSSMRQLTSLRWTNYLGILTIYYVVFFIIIRFLLGTETNSGTMISDDVRWFHIDGEFIKGFPILSVSYSCHYNIPTYYGELLNRSPKRFGKAIGIATPIIMTTYVVAGLCGYLMFGSAQVTKAKGNIMTAFPPNDPASTVGQLGLFFHFTSVFPIVALACRRCVNQLILGSPWQSQKLYVIQALFLVSSSCALAYLVPGVGVIVEIIGALFGLSIVYIIPASFYIKLGGERGPTFEEVQAVDEEREAEVQKLLLNKQQEEGTLDNNFTAPASPPSGVAVNQGGAVSKTEEEGGGAAIDRGEEDPDDSPKPIVVSQQMDKRLYRLAWCFVVCGIFLSAGSFIFTIYTIANPSS